MREKAAQLVQLIPRDCPGLTVHDVSHLDALWETADLIAGSDFEINPAEAFVFGAAVLLHDSAMSLAAFPDGMSEVTATTEWNDAAHAAFKKRDIDNPSTELIVNPPEEIRTEVLFSVLRVLHARQAENLVSISWKIPGKEDQIRILDDQKLRNAYGRSIGLIAHSHHWDIERLSTELREDAGIATDLPNEWTLNEVKIACLLRCADAAHIDDRRAPSFTYALTSPTDVSELHWNFQNKVNKPVFKSGSLLYSSGPDFEIGDAAAWWLCFDTIKMIDKELSSANALLQDTNGSKFAASRVFGADNPSILSRQIRTSGWTPVDAEIRVTNPIDLAQTLGGRNLYGSGAFAPIRELLQNAVDAVRARRKLENRPETWGLVNVTLEKDQESEDGSLWLHVDDNGVGMSERVLVGPLLDFGKSLWRSSQLHTELPGLESRNFRPVGKFGIGFFSVFLLGQNVQVISKGFMDGIDDARVLEFSAIGSRPVLRAATDGELPIDFSTRISVKISDPEIVSGSPPTDHWHSEYGRFGEKKNIREVLGGNIRQLIAALDVCVEINDLVENKSYSHSFDWHNVTADKFLKELLSETSPRNRDSAISTHGKHLANLTNESGEILGRAALHMGSSSQFDRNIGSALNLVSVGGFVSRASNLAGKFSYLGVISGRTDEVSRYRASPDISDSVLSRWATDEANLIDMSRFSVSDLMRACHQIVFLGGDPSKLPFCFTGGDFVSFEDFRNLVRDSDVVRIPLTRPFGDELFYTKIEDLTTQFFNPGTISSVFATNTHDHRRILDSETAKIVMDEAPSTIDRESLEGAIERLDLDIVFGVLDAIWGEEWQLLIEEREIFSGDYYTGAELRWVLTIKR